MDRLKEQQTPNPFNKDSEQGPKKDTPDRPDVKKLLERMRRVDPDAAKKYRQRSGE